MIKLFFTFTYSIIIRFIFSSKIVWNLCLIACFLNKWGQKLFKVAFEFTNNFCKISYKLSILNMLKVRIKEKRFKKIAWTQSHHLQHQWKFKLLSGKIAWGKKAKHCWVDVNKLYALKSLLTMPSNVSPLDLKKTFWHII